MDPVSAFSVVAGAAGLAVQCAGVAQTLYNLASNFKNAELTIRCLADECETIQLAWRRIGQWTRDATNDVAADIEVLERLDQSMIRGMVAAVHVLLEVIKLPSLGDRNKVLVKEAHVLRRSDESAWTIVQSRPSTIVNSIASSETKASVELTYRRLSFEDDLFTAPVYKRNYISLVTSGRFPTNVQRPNFGNGTFRASQPALDNDDDSVADASTKIVAPSISRYDGSSHEASSTFDSHKGTEVWNGSVKIPAPSMSELNDDTFDPVDIVSGLALLNWAERLGYALPVNGPADNWLLDVAASQNHWDILRRFLRSSSRTDTYEWMTKTFFCACEQGNERMVKILIESALDVNCLQAVTNWTGLHVAALHNRVQLGELLLSLGAKIDAKDSRGNEAIHISSRFGMTAFMSFLLGSGASANCRNHGDRSPIDLAVDRSCVESVRLLWEAGAWKDSSCIARPEVALFVQSAIASPERHGPGRTQPIHLASECGLVSIMAELVKAGAPVHSFDEKGLQPIHLATLSLEDKCIAFLVLKGADVDARTCDADGYTPLQLACSRGLKSSVRALLHFKASCTETQWSRSPFGLAVLGRHADVIVTLLVMNPEIDASNPDVGGPALSALLQGRHEGGIFPSPSEICISVLRVLLKYGLDVNVQHLDGDRALDKVCWYECYIFLPWLLVQNGYDLNAIDSRRNQALHDIAGFSKKYDLQISSDPTPLWAVTLLLEYGADIDAVNHEGKTALQIAAEHRKLWLVNCLLEWGAKRLSAAGLEAITRPVARDDFYIRSVKSKIMKALKAPRPLT